MATSLMLALAVILGALGALVALGVLRGAVSRAIEDVVMLTLDEEPPRTVSESRTPYRSRETSRGPHDSPTPDRT
jgi:hypothetical protein